MMRAHISKKAGDVGVFKSFKDKMSVLIDELIEVVVSWVTTAWRQVPNSVVQQSVDKCGFFANSSDWFISKHDVYGSQFDAAWSARSDVTHIVSSDSDIEDDTNSTFDEVLDTLDEIVINE
ncbi:hypothetical protein F443_10250 [Phytophthora nicotianae P1569]|uniref:DDE-1 domain-containing protein n=1 Tax=Phytophthora nicotianae P1569 TaxID=1317065 RepID=V9F210_PHYNI|nr:hypothetical protein F443_10250 [Phytophthora nicotianae P1569]